MTIFNPGGAYGQSAQGEYKAVSVINATTTAITKNKLVRISTGLTDGWKVAATVGLGATDAVGVLDSDLPASGNALAVTKGPHLIAVTSDATPSRLDLLVASSSTAGAVKTSTYAAAAETARGVVGICLSSTLDSSGTFVLAYITL